MVQAHIRAVALRASQNKYWREDDARAVLTALADSGLPLSEFSRQFGISAKRIERWHKRLEMDPGPPSARAASSGDVAFHPIHVVVDEGADSGLELVLGNGRRIAVRGDFDPQVLERLVRCLDELPC